MRQMSLARKIGIGSGILIVLLSVVTVWSTVGIGRIVGNGKQVISGNQLRAEMLQREVDHLNWATKVLNRLADTKGGGLDVQLDPRKCAFGEWYYGDGRTRAEALLPAIKPLLAEIEVSHTRLHESAKGIDTALRGENGHAAAMAIYREQTAPSLDAVRGTLKKIAETAKENIMSDAQMVSVAEKARLGVMVLGGIACALGILLSVLFARSVASSLKRVIAKVSGDAGRVSTTCSQLRGSSQSLAEGSSEQAASLEETASAMEEMSAMTRSNTDSAGQAKNLSDSTARSVEKADASMNQLVGRMAEISSMGEEIGKIIRTIDEIAFQTNLLALNAAVEAARAGEAGAGFAVVADEVRNLAQRAAGAARNTSELIEGAIRKIKDGTELVEKTNADFSEVTSSVRKVKELVAEISAASEEQARGIGEVSTAVSQMDKVTQANAASAEEIAAASEELSSQAESLSGVVDRLKSVVDGGAWDRERTQDAAGTSASRRGTPVPSLASASAAKIRKAFPPSPANRNAPDKANGDAREEALSSF